MSTQTNQMRLSAALTASFTGKTSHAAAAPDLGRSAFDALQMAVWGMELLHKHVSDGIDVRCRIISSGNMPCNIVPDQAEGTIMIQTDSEKKLEWAKARVEDIVAGAAMATGTVGRIAAS